MEPRAGPQRSRWCRPQGSPHRENWAGGLAFSLACASLRMREAQWGRLPLAAVRMMLNALVPAEWRTTRTRGPSLPPACGGLFRPEVGVPLPGAHRICWGSRGAAFTSELHCADGWSAGQFSRWGPLTGIARERETSADDTAPYQRKGRTLSGVRESARIAGPSGDNPNHPLGGAFQGHRSG